MKNWDAIVIGGGSSAPGPNAARRVAVVDDLRVEIHAMRELRYEQMMKRATIMPRLFVKLERRTANPPADL